MSAWAVAAAPSVLLSDVGTPLLGIAASGNGSEAGPVNGQFTVTLSEASTTDTIAQYTVSGSAINGFDYETLSGFVTIVAGETSATIDVVVIDDAQLESLETVGVELAGITDGDPQIQLDTDHLQAEVQIADNEIPRLSLAATANGDESSPFVGSFTVTQSLTTTAPTVIGYTVTGTATNGTDYTTLTGELTIGPGLSFGPIPVFVTNDNLIEGVETVTVTLTSIISGDSRLEFVPTATESTIDILDDDSGVLSIARTADGNEATLASAIFTVTQSAVSSTDTVVRYLLSGAATSGVDYTTPSGTVTIAAGQTTATITAPVLGDNLIEPNETIIVTLDSITSGNPGLSIDSAHQAATASILDDDPALVRIDATQGGDENGPFFGIFTVTLSATSTVDTVVSYTVSGTATRVLDFTDLSGEVTIPAGQTSASIEVPVIDDDVIEGVESVSITLSAVGGPAQIGLDQTAKSAEVNIADNDFNFLSIELTLNANEAGPVTGQFTIRQTAAILTDTVVSLKMEGTAIDGVDFETLPDRVTIPAGSTSVILNVVVIDDLLLEGDETLRVDLDGVLSGDPIMAIDNNLRLAFMTILDDDVAKVSIAPAADASEAGPTSGRFTVSMSAISPTDTVVVFVMSGTADSGSDFDNLGTTFTIPAGESSVTIEVPAFDDAIVEGDETVTMTLVEIQSGNPQVIVSPDEPSATLTIADDDTAVVTIAALSSGQEAGPVNGIFKVTQSAISSSDTVILYTISGSAEAGLDYTALSGTVTIPAGETSATINVEVIDDTLLENLESIELTLANIVSGGSQIHLGTGQTQAVVQIVDNEIPLLSISGGDSVLEGSVTPGSFVISQSLATATNTVVSYTVSGTATAGADYTVLSGTATIPAGQTSVTVQFVAIDDILVEGTESVIVTLNSVTAGDDRVSIVPGASQATTEIEDNDSAVVGITKTNDTSEVGGADGKFSVTLSAASSTTTVIAYQVSGTATAGSDYTALSGTVTIPAGQTSATITVVPLADILVEGNETVVVTLTSITSANAGVTIDAAHQAATVTIADDDSTQVRVAVATHGSEAGAVSAVFTVTLTAASSTDTVAAYTVTGTATAGVDYTAPSGTVTIPAGQTTASISVPILDDTVAEGAESLIVTLTNLTNAPPSVAIDASAATATAQIADNDFAQVRVAKVSDGNEAGAVAPVFAITLTNASATSTTVHYTLGGSATAGSDYTAPAPLSVTIPAGQTSANISLPLLADAAFEGTESVTITLDSLTGANDNVSIDAANHVASANILDDETGFVGIAFTADGSETGPAAGRFTITQNGTTTVNTVIAYTVSGSATSGSDYTALSGTVTIPAGQTSAVIDVPVLDDQVVESAESVVVTLTQITSGATGLSIDAAHTAATLSIADNDSALVSIAATTGGNETGPVNGLFTVTQSRASSQPTVVTYTVSGTATAGSDYTTLSGTVTIPAGQTSATIPVAVIDDNLLESQESVIVTISNVSGSSQVSLDAGQASATVQIADNEIGQVTIAATTNANEAGPVNGRFTITQSVATSTPTIVSYSVGGTASLSSDFAGLSLTATIPAGQTSVTVDIAALDDSIVEGTETVVLTLTSLSGDPHLALGTTNSATVQITDNDSATVGFSQTTSTAIEATGTHTVTVRLTVAGGGSLERPVTINVVDTHTGTATAADYALTTGSVTFAAGSHDGDTQNVVLSLVADGVAESPGETVVLNLTLGSDGTGGRITLGSSTTHTVTISDDSSIGAVSGFVWIDGNNNQVRDTNEMPIPGVTVRLTGTNSGGQAVDRTVVTDITGAYSFAGVAAGTYTITERQPVAFMDGGEKLGTVAGAASGTAGADTFTGVVLQTGQQAINYNFGEIGLRAQYLNQLMFLTSTSAATIQRIVQKTEPASTATAAASTANAQASLQPVSASAAISMASAVANTPAESAAVSTSTISTPVAKAVTLPSYAAPITSIDPEINLLMIASASVGNGAPEVSSSSAQAALEDSTAIADSGNWDSTSLAAAIDLISAATIAGRANPPMPPNVAVGSVLPLASSIASKPATTGEPQQPILSGGFDQWSADASGAEASDQGLEEAIFGVNAWLDSNEIAGL